MHSPSADECIFHFLCLDRKVNGDTDMYSIFIFWMTHMPPDSDSNLLWNWFDKLELYSFPLSWQCQALLPTVFKLSNSDLGNGHDGRIVFFSFLSPQFIDWWFTLWDFGFIFLGRVCPFTGKKANKANKVSFSNHKTIKRQFVNLQYKRVWWEAGKRYVKLRLSTKALKTIEKNGLDAVAKKAGIDLSKK